MSDGSGARYAKVAVADAVFAIDRPYDYAVPEVMRADIAPGCRVLVPFGRGNRRSEGFVLALAGESRVERTKPVAALLDRAPVLDGEAIRLALWMRERCVCTCYEAARAMLPAGLWHAFVETVTLTPGIDRAEAQALLAQSPKAARLLDALYGAPEGRLPVCDAEELLGGSSALRDALRTLAGKGLAEGRTVTRRRVGDKTVRGVRLAVPVEDARALAAARAARAPMQTAVLTLLCEAETVPAHEISYLTGARPAMLTQLARRGLVTFEEREVYRRPAGAVREQAAPVVLNDGQRAVLARLAALTDAGRPACALLFGVTGSGKTLVYLELIRHIGKQGGQSIVMVPEIVLTPQLMETFSRAFGERVALLHSGLSLGERYDEWKRIRAGGVDVVLGTRSAVFAPLTRLKLIVMDEEQEHSYKSENVPRYHARDIAKYRCARSGGLLLLGSATPSVESMFFARSGRYVFLEMPARYNARALPRVLMADLRQELREGNAGALSAVLCAEIEKNLAAGQQSILFLNRRGYNRLLLCESCGVARGCPRCSVTLTFHAANDRLMCHRCGHSEKRPDVCPDCAGALRPVGTGTQKVEEELHALFPGVGVLRMDADTTAGQGAHAKLLARFREERIPLLIGTQMVTKGLDFENVTLVGVLDADMALHTGEFRAHERAFSLITQVVGRAGRGEKPGRAVIQTFAPDHPVLTAAAAQDYEAFYRDEIALRQATGLPPFYDIVTLVFSGADPERVQHACLRLRRAVERTGRRFFTQILGPAPAPVWKLNNRYRYHLTLTGHYDKAARAHVGGLLTVFKEDGQNRGLHLYADLNAY
ncbi:MAG: primosomal protein N' [Oscillospiraceae bacterium]|jgi:primosomal protein N' (replication factor Y)|nr:primosomal protein N' [Oscillospiraceae bacterium]